MIRLLSLIFALALLGCNGKSKDVYVEEEGSISFAEDGYEDGTYCAEIDYYYSETGTSSSYTLEVEIEDNELTVIHWPNGGWLDSSHFSPPDISDGEASFTSDVGVDYTVEIIGDSGGCVTDSYAQDEDDLVRSHEDQERQEENRIREEEDQQRQVEEEEEEEEERHRLEDEEKTSEE
jgi:hypothetical protein